MKEIYEKLLELKRRGYTYYELEEMTGVSRSTICRLVVDEKDINFRNFEKLTEFFKTFDMTEKTE